MEAEEEGAEPLPLAARRLQHKTTVDFASREARPRKLPVERYSPLIPLPFSWNEKAIPTGARNT